MDIDAALRVPAAALRKADELHAWLQQHGSVVGERAIVKELLIALSRQGVQSPAARRQFIQAVLTAAAEMVADAGLDVGADEFGAQFAREARMMAALRRLRPRQGGARLAVGAG